MNRLIKTCSLLVFLVVFLLTNHCLAVAFRNPLGGGWYDPNNWYSEDWNEPNIPYCAPDFNNIESDRVIIGNDPPRSGATNMGYLIVTEDVNIWRISLGAQYRSYGKLDILPDANIQLINFITSSGGDSLSVINMYGGALHCPPTVPYEPMSSWAALARGGYCYFNQYGGHARFSMNLWAHSSLDTRLFLNVSGGLFEALGRPVPMLGKVYINVSGTGTVRMNDWDLTDNDPPGFYPFGTAGTWFTLNGAGTLIAWGDWTSDTTLDGLLTSDSNVIAEIWSEDSRYTKLTTDACGAIPDPDLDADCDVDFKDYSSFAEEW